MMKISETRERELLIEMRGRGWFRPLDLGGHNGSHHSYTLTRLVKKGLVERKQRSSHQSRPSYVYRALEAGRR